MHCNCFQDWRKVLPELRECAYSFETGFADVRFSNCLNPSILRLCSGLLDGFAILIVSGLLLAGAAIAIAIYGRL